MDTILQGIPNVICYLDDILVTGPDDEAHWRSLTSAGTAWPPFEAPEVQVHESIR